MDVGIWVLFVIAAAAGRCRRLRDRQGPGRRRACPSRPVKPAGRDAGTPGIEPAPAFSADDLIRGAEGGVADERRHADEPALLAARRDRHRQRRRAQGRLDDRPEGLRGRSKVLGRGAADRLRGRHVRPDRRRRRLRRQRRQRRDPLGIQGEPGAEDQHGLLRLAHPRRRARRRQGLPRPARRQARRARPGHRQGRLADGRRALAGGLHDHARRRSTTTAWSSSAAPVASSRSAGGSPAYDAKTGEQEWRFYTIPGPGETGHDTWPQDNDAWKTGGAPVWQTPAVDPELGLLYFSTGNAVARPERQQARGRQPVHGLDRRRRREDRRVPLALPAGAPRHLGLRRPEPGRPLRRRRRRKGLAQASKTGWLYLLDRETGEPLLPIEEQPVPQLAARRPPRPSRSRAIRPSSRRK